MTVGASGVVVVGEALVDIVDRAGVVDEVPGGSPANVALTLGRLGRMPILVTRLADDDRGCRVRQWLEDSGVAVIAAGAPRTATAVAHLDAAGAARYEFDLDWDLGEILGDLAGVLTSARLIHIGSIAALLDPGGLQVESVVRALRDRVTVTYDPNIRPSLVDDPAAVRARVAALIGLADVVKASDEDLRWLHPGRDLVDVAREWQARGPALVVVTRGAEGALAVTADGVIRVPTVRTEVVDTVGAGDTFMGTLIDGVLALGGAGAALRALGGGIRPGALEEVLGRCVQASAITVSRQGADPPRLEELAAFTL